MSAGRMEKVRERDGRLVEFDQRRIEAAIAAAARAAGETGISPARLASLAVERLAERGDGAIPAVDDIRSAVEATLRENAPAPVARCYAARRRQHPESGSGESLLEVDDDLGLPLNALAVLKHRYLARDENGNVIETPAGLFRRVAAFVAAAEERYGGDADQYAERFYQAMAAREFLPNSPTLMNAGSRLGLLSACFVLPVPDSIPDIFTAVKDMAVIHQAGGGTGFSFSRLRPRGDIVGSTMGVASGPVSFMRAFDSATEAVKQGGRRRGANMGVLRVDHPDILDFIAAKQQEGSLANFNISVAVDDAFMDSALAGREYDLVNPRTGARSGRLPAEQVLNAIAAAAWQTGDPGLLFIDRINEDNPTPRLGAIEATNPCGEQPLLPYESCNLGSIELSRLVRDGDFDWQRLEELVKLGVRFLDDVIDVNRFPLPEIEAMTLANRKIGLGVMGFAEALLRLGIPYDSEAALETAQRLMRFISRLAVEASVELGRQRGSFPNFPESTWRRRGFAAMRNATVTTIAPTGTISVIAGTTSGIEPLFAISFVREVMDGIQLLETNPEFEEAARRHGIYSQELMAAIARSGSIRDMDGVPGELKSLFVTALDISPEWHLRMQAAFQQHVDNAVSKTINMPHEAGIEDVRRAMLRAWELRLKGVTVFRYGSRRRQVLYRAGDSASHEEEHARAAPGFAGGCPAVDCEY